MNKLKEFIHNWGWVVLLSFIGIGFFYPIIGALALFCMTAPIIVAIFKGRKWCGNYCPRGSFNDIVLSRFTFNKSMPRFMKKLWFRNLFLVLLMSSFALQLVIKWGSFSSIGSVFVFTIFVTTSISIVLGIFFKPRTWCMICPMGTFAHYVSKARSKKTSLQHVTFSQNGCVNCKMCSKSCPMEIDVLKHKTPGKVLDANCLKCNVCVDKCPKKTLKIA